MNETTIERLNRIEKIMAENAEITNLINKYQEQALQRRYELEIACIPEDSPLRVLEVDEEWLKKVQKKGFTELFGLRLIRSIEI